MWTGEWAHLVRLTLTGLGVLVTAAGALAAGVTTGGLISRTALAGVGFWMAGTAMGRLIAWCASPVPQPGIPRSGAALPQGKGQALDVTLPATRPPDE